MGSVDFCVWDGVGKNYKRGHKLENGMGEVGAIEKEEWK